MINLKIERLVLGAVSTNTYIVSYGKNCIIIDPADDADKIIAFIETSELIPRAILLTHGHFDHCLAAPTLSKYYSVKNFLGAYDEPLIKAPKLNMSRYFLGEDFSMSPDILIKEDEELSFEELRIRAVSTAGHTKGSLSFYIEDVEEMGRIMFTGDAVFRGSIGRTDFPTGDENELKNTIERVYKKLPKDTILFPGHGSSTTIEIETCNNPYFM